MLFCPYVLVYVNIFATEPYLSTFPLQSLSHRVCLWRLDTPSSGDCGNFWSKGVVLILGRDDTIKKMQLFFFLNNMNWPPHPVYTCQPNTPPSRCHGDFWLKNLFLILACNDTIKNIVLLKKQTPKLDWPPLPPPPTRKSKKKTLLGVMETSGWRLYSQYWPAMTQLATFLNPKSRLGDYFDMGASIRIGSEIQYLLCAGFL